MKTVNISINQKPFQVDPQSTVLEACRKAGVHIPVLCNAQGLEPYESCMICVVEDAATGKIIPSCSAGVVQGMDIRTDTPQIRALRKSAVEMLLSEHEGDCEAPCTRACPLRTDIPGMLRALIDGNAAAALSALQKENPFAGTLSLVCSGPCENVCRRGRYDQPLLIRKLIAAIVAAEENSERGIPKTGAASETSSGKRIAVVGAGISGLTVAWCILSKGYGCAVFESRTETGGMLTEQFGKDPMFREMLALETAKLKALGAELRMNIRVGTDITWDALRKDYDAVLIAVGSEFTDAARAVTLSNSDRGIGVDDQKRMTDVKGVFAAGAAVREMKMAARASQDAKIGAEACMAFLEQKEFRGPFRRFDSRTGKPDEREINEFLRTCRRPRKVADGTREIEISDDHVRHEAERCLCCDCAARTECKLRDLADQTDADPKACRPEKRKRIERVADDTVVYEPGKCIKCGICVRKSRDVDGQSGLAFRGRGYETRIVAPSGFTIGSAIQKNAAECIRACPTGALYFR